MRTKTEIVILNWNGAGHLRRFLPSVLASVPEGVGVVVADNGSTDDSLGVLEREFPAVGRIVLDRNYGFAGGYNRALEYLDADYFILLNSDVETPAGWVEPLVETLDRDRTVAAVAPKLLSLVEPARFEYAGASGGFIDYLGYPFCRGRILQCVERDEGQYDDARDVFWASGAAFCCRAEVFRAMGGFDEDFFAHMEEIDLCWRMQLAGYRVRIEPRSRVYHLGGGSASGARLVRGAVVPDAGASGLRAGRGTCVAGFSAGAQGAGRQAAGCSRCGEGEAPGHILRVDRSALFIRSQTVRQVAVKGRRFECDRCLMCRCSDGGDLSWR